MLNQTNDVLSKYSLSFEDFMKYYKKSSEDKDSDIVLLDFREEEEFNKGFIQKSIFCDKNFFMKLVKPSSNLLLITQNGYEEDVVNLLLQNNYQNIIGFLDGGVDTWILNKQRLSIIHESSNPNSCDMIIDCREPREWNYGVINNSKFMQLGLIPSLYKTLDKNLTYGILCKRGGRSIVASTYLQAKGFKVVNISGGIRNLICGGVKLMKKFIK